MPHQDHNKLHEADPKASLAQNTALGFYQPLPGPDPIRIYVACLASYNAGTLYGRWIDATSEAEIWDAVQAMLKGSEKTARRNGLFTTMKALKARPSMNMIALPIFAS